jgi:hypothetical protein
MSTMKSKGRPGELIHIDIKKLGRIGDKGPGHRVRGVKHHNKSKTDAAGVRRKSDCHDNAVAETFATIRRS